MATNLAQARRNAYGDNTSNAAAAMDSGSMYYNANGSKTGARIDGRVRRKTMMGGSNSGPISMRANRSEAMEQEADAAMERQHRRGIERARQERIETAQAVHAINPQSAGASQQTAEKPAGRLIPGSSPGSSIYVKDGDAKPQASGGVRSPAATMGQSALLAARRSRTAQNNLKAKQDRNFSRIRADMERTPEQYPFAKQVTRIGKPGQPGMAQMREEARQRGELDKY